MRVLLPLAAAVVIVMISSTASFAQMAGAEQRSPLLTSDSGPVVRSVLARNDRLNEAFAAADFATLDSLIDEHGLQVTVSGAQGKAQWLGPVRAGAKRVRPAGASAWRRTRVYGRLAVLSSAATFSVTNAGASASFDAINSRVWIKEGGEWRLLLAQNTPRTDAPAAEATRAVLPAAPALMPATSAEAAVMAANRRIDSLDLAPDSIALTRVYGEDFLNITQGAEVRGRAERMRTLLSSEPRYEHIDTDDVRAHVVGDAALVTGRSLVRVRARGAVRQGPIRFARIFVRRGDAWELVFQQLTRVPG